MWSISIVNFRILIFSLNNLFQSGLRQRYWTVGWEILRIYETIWCNSLCVFVFVNWYLSICIFLAWDIDIGQLGDSQNTRDNRITNFIAEFSGILEGWSFVIDLLIIKTIVHQFNHAHAFLSRIHAESISTMKQS